MLIRQGNPEAKPPFVPSTERPDQPDSSAYSNETAALLISLTANFSHLNFRFFKLPATIGVMLIALLMSLALIGAGHFAPWIHEAYVTLIKNIDFNDTRSSSSEESVIIFCVTFFLQNVMDLWQPIPSR